MVTLFLDDFSFVGHNCSNVFVFTTLGGFFDFNNWCWRGSSITIVVNDHGFDSLLRLCRLGEKSHLYDTEVLQVHK